MKFLWKINIKSKQEARTVYDDDDGDGEGINDLYIV
jgi:hypothetical protein